MECKCSICSTDFDFEDEGGVKGFIGILSVQFCPTCLNGLREMFEQLSGIMKCEECGLTVEEVCTCPPNALDKVAAKCRYCGSETDLKTITIYEQDEHYDGTACTECEGKFYTTSSKPIQCNEEYRGDMACGRSDEG